MLTLVEGRETPTPANLAERRRGLRIRQCRPVKVYEPRTSRYFPGRTADISANGLRLKLPLSTPVLAGSTLCLHIGLDKPGDTLASRRHMLDARVIWTRRDNNGAEGQLTAGLELLATAAIQVHAA
ncbi:MAG TPA: PilZ domain-containing protein [Tepidisphaeraceae bacterium]|jgi:hypothetical protein|nr:PilZ domain-containing protein [Tepidisphaeraceae bacterium]